MSKILVVDDHPQTHRLVQVALNSLKMEVLGAPDGVEGLATAEREHPAVIILDITMPRMGGLEVLRALKANAELQGIPVIMLTAQDEAPEIDEAMAAGADHFIAKPFKPTEVLATVKRALGTT